MITYEDDVSDTRVIGEEYDIEEEGDLSSFEEEEADLDDLLENGETLISDYYFWFKEEEIDVIKDSLIKWAKLNPEYGLDLKQEDGFEDVFRKLGFDQSFDLEPDGYGWICVYGDSVGVLDELSYPFKDFLRVLLPYLQNSNETDCICTLETEYEYVHVNKMDGELVIE